MWHLNEIWTVMKEKWNENLDIQQNQQQMNKIETNKTRMRTWRITEQNQNNDLKFSNLRISN